jgi:hypothetical protein
VKHYETGDGMFFQFVVCIGIWISGMVVFAVQSFPKFYAVPLLGGVIWSTGNLCTVPVIKFLGIGLGSLFWNIVSLVVGWANARYGWFGVTKIIPANSFLNYLGVAFAIGSIAIFVLVETDAQTVRKGSDRDDKKDEENQAIVNNDYSNEDEEVADYYNQQSQPVLKITRVKKIIGILLSMFAGVMYGVCYTPILYVQDNYANASLNQNDYSFSYNTGIFLGSLFYFILYCIYKKNKPDVYPEIIFPAFISGAMWLVCLIFHSFTLRFFFSLLFFI